jgi:hypothetical protein
VNSYNIAMRGLSSIFVFMVVAVACTGAEVAVVGTSVAIEQEPIVTAAPTAMVVATVTAPPQPSL